VYKHYEVLLKGHDNIGRPDEAQRQWKWVCSPLRKETMGGWIVSITSLIPSISTKRI
jgi:hypothetical protein